MDNNPNLKVLKELHKGAQMGINALSYVSDKVTDDNFKRELSTQYNQYEDMTNQEILDRIKKFKVTETPDVNNRKRLVRLLNKVENN